VPPQRGSGSELAQTALKGQARNAIDQEQFLTEGEQQQLGFGMVVGEGPQGLQVAPINAAAALHLDGRKQTGP